MKKLLLAGVLFAQASTAQTVTVQIPEVHDTIDDIMELSNPACLINGRVKVLRDEVSSRSSYRFVDDIQIKPEWFKWEKECEQFHHNHFTDFEVPNLHRFHINQSVVITYVKENNNWSIMSVLPGGF